MARSSATVLGRVLRSSDAYLRTTIDIGNMVEAPNSCELWDYRQCMSGDKTVSKTTCGDPMPANLRWNCSEKRGISTKAAQLPHHLHPTASRSHAPRQSGSAQRMLQEPLSTAEKYLAGKEKAVGMRFDAIHEGRRCRSTATNSVRTVFEQLFLPRAGRASLA